MAYRDELLVEKGIDNPRIVILQKGMKDILYWMNDNNRHINVFEIKSNEYAMNISEKMPIMRYHKCDMIE